MGSMVWSSDRKRRSYEIMRFDGDGDDDGGTISREDTYSISRVVLLLIVYYC